MNRKEFQAWLDQFPEDTEIEVANADGWYSYESFVADTNQFGYTDCARNKLMGPDHPHYQKKFLRLG